MNMLDDDGDIFYATLESYSWFSFIEWSAVELMSSAVGKHAVCALLSALDRGEQHAAIAKFIQHEFDTSHEKAPLLHHQGSQHAELLRQQQAHNAVPGETHARLPKTLKIDISKYRRAEEDSLLR